MSFYNECNIFFLKRKGLSDSKIISSTKLQYKNMIV